VSDKKILMEGVQLWSVGKMLSTWICVCHVLCRMTVSFCTAHDTHADL